MLCALYFFLCDIQWHTQVTDNARVQHEQTALLKTTMQSTDTTSVIWVHASSGNVLNFRPSLVSPEAVFEFWHCCDIELRVLPTVDFDRHTCRQYQSPPTMASYQTVKCRKCRRLCHNLDKDKDNYTTMFIFEPFISTQFTINNCILPVPITDRHTCIGRATPSCLGTCSSVPHIFYAIGKMLMLLIIFLQHQSLKKPPVSKLLEQVPQLKLFQAAVAHNPPLISQVMEQLPHHLS